jgi:hypothetical protein
LPAFYSKDKLNVDLGIGIGHITGRPDGAFLLNFFLLLTGRPDGTIQFYLNKIVILIIHAGAKQVTLLWLLCAKFISSISR